MIRRAEALENRLLFGEKVGAGLDYAFTNNWFTGLEYRYSQYDDKTFTYPIPIQNLGIVGFKQAAVQAVPKLNPRAVSRTQNAPRPVARPD